MLEPGTRLFVNTRLDGERLLHPATVEAVEGESMALELQEGGPTLEAGQPVEIYFQQNRKFFKQKAHVAGVGDGSGSGEGDETLLVSVTPHGEPEVAEARQHFRVVTLFEGLTAVLAGETGKLADVSVCGLSIIVGGRHDLASSVPISFEHDGTTYSGTVIIQSVKQLPDGGNRYGLLCSPNDAELQKGLQCVSMDVQRRQLRRRAAA